MTDAATLPHVLIAIPTYRRAESLTRLLRSIEELQAPCDVSVLVADNEGAGGEGLSVVNAIRTTYRFPITGIAVPEKGLANVRNAMIAYGRSHGHVNFIAMIDDDERPTPQWLSALLAMQAETGADVVGGPTEPVFPHGTAEWARGCSLFTCGTFPDGPVDMIWGTCNAMFHRSAFAGTEDVLFDPVFNDWGGEDVDAFMRLRARGCSFGWAAHAVVLDDIPASRTTWRWVARRAFRVGNSNMFAQLRWVYGEGGRSRAFIPAIVGLLAHSGRLVLTLPWRAKRVESFCLLMRSAGKLAFLGGFKMKEYGSANLSPPRPVATA
jgi:glycosyltransferase involved in cell wall biosynthesis